MEIKESWKKEAKVNKEDYNSLYLESINNNEAFWSKHGNRIDWKKKIF